MQLNQPSRLELSGLINMEDAWDSGAQQRVRPDELETVDDSQLKPVVHVCTRESWVYPAAMASE